MTTLEDKMTRAANIVRDAGGEIVGRTKLQKIAYFLEITGLGEGYRFSYQYYGPYSDELSNDIKKSWAFDLVDKQERLSTWGGNYSIYRSTPRLGEPDFGVRSELARQAASIGAVELELAATAAFLRIEGFDDPWEETKRRKPEKADRINAAKEAYRRLMRIETPRALPDIV